MSEMAQFKHFIWTEDAKPLNYNPKTRPRRQDFFGSFVENGAFYISNCEQLASSEVRLHGKIGIYEMTEETKTEIDTIEDWKIIEPILLENIIIIKYIFSFSFFVDNSLDMIIFCSGEIIIQNEDSIPIIK